ncbi:MAG: hypothetical protein IJL06_05820 [Kiritimatiellae bacterium]|nr:hypothetical protein [Kiritimatiellia bacterium]
MKRLLLLLSIVLLSAGCGRAKRAAGDAASAAAGATKAVAVPADTPVRTVSLSLAASVP